MTSSINENQIQLKFSRLFSDLNDEDDVSKRNSFTSQHEVAHPPDIVQVKQTLQSHGNGLVLPRTNRQSTISKQTSRFQRLNYRKRILSFVFSISVQRLSSSDKFSQSSHTGTVVSQKQNSKSENVSIEEKGFLLLKNVFRSFRKGIKMMGADHFDAAYQYLKRNEKLKGEQLKFDDDSLSEQLKMFLEDPEKRSVLNELLALESLTASI